MPPSEEVRCTAMGVGIVFRVPRFLGLGISMPVLLESPLGAAAAAPTWLSSATQAEAVIAAEEKGEAVVLVLSPSSFSIAD